jgi:hypothetical protein
MTHVFEIELTSNPRGSKIIMDGRPIVTKSIKIEASCDSIPLVTITVPATVKMIGNLNADTKEG